MCVYTFTYIYVYMNEMYENDSSEMNKKIRHTEHRNEKKKLLSSCIEKYAPPNIPLVGSDDAADDDAHHTISRT